MQGTWLSNNAQARVSILIESGHTNGADLRREPGHVGFRCHTWCVASILRSQSTSVALV